MADWQKQTLALPKNHRWQAKRGWGIFAADRGAVRFNYPMAWEMKVTEHGSFQFRDRPVPYDDCLMEVSVMYLNPQVNWAGLPLEDTLKGLVVKGERNLTIERVVREERPNLDLVWCESSFTDTNENRLAYDRELLAYNNFVMPFLTMVYWPEHEDRFVPVWDEVIKTLHVGEPVTLRGPVRKKTRR